MMNNYYGYPSYPQRQEVIHVNGRNGAEAYQMMPNSSALLLDENEPICWLCQTDGAGYKVVTPYRIEPYVEKKPADLNSLEERIAALEGKLNESYSSKYSGKQDDGSRQNVSGVQNGAKSKSDDRRPDSKPS